MKYKILKQTNEKLSSVVMGTDGLGSEYDKADSFKLLDIYTDMGGNVIDTASLYGGEEEHYSEKLIGEWIRKRKCREKVFISTKGGHPKCGKMNISRLSRNEIRHDIEMSLKNIGVDCVDIYWLHRDDEKLDAGEITQIMAELVREGKTRFIGMSNWSYKRIDEANRYAKEYSLPMIISSQLQFSPAKAVKENNDPTLVLMNDEEFGYFSEHDMSVFAFAAQAKGFFSLYDRGGAEQLSDKARTRYLSDENIKRYQRIKEISEKRGISVAMTVIAAMVSNPYFQTFPIIGNKDPRHLKEAISGADTELSKEEFCYIFGL